MNKQRKRKPATLRTDAEFLAEQMAAAATMMWTVAERMEYFAGFNPKLSKHGRQLAGASVILREWAGFVREQANEQNGGGK
jgi:hypothetical protein